MNLRTISAACVILSAMAITASAGEISKSSLNQMGFGKMQVLSDTDGMTVRGKGTSASAWGSGTAVFFGNSSTNGYSASASHHSGSSTAVGANVSTAGVISNHGFVLSVAGGGSFAFAK